MTRNSDDTSDKPAAAHRPAAGQGGRSSSLQIVRDVVRGLYEGRYVPGQRLVEPDLMRRYKVSRPTVREALTRLAAEGVATVLPHRGAQIRQLTRRDAGNILAILEVTIGLAARLAAERIDAPGAAAHFKTAYAELAAFAGERDSYDLVRARNRFYRAITRIGGNADLERLLSSFQVHLIRANLHQPPAQRFADYAAIADAILGGRPRIAEEAARDHIRHLATAVADAPDDLFAPADDRPPAFNTEDFDHA
ncbi:GntR family transcriptional regulator [Pseudohoeflea coraliihabitans]|uniref:GntR family transcriptional regulator n=1 Tax=Pseudohoeflea coraliihabitans TaxID=2860393 RepID=A0ABS6WMB1_9HYPH|nr:GntR family transcriptional regulator [Pseudohoeflea sp. DP4N28-3]